MSLPSRSHPAIPVHRPVGTPLAGLWRTWRSLNRREAEAFLLFAGGVGVLNGLVLADGRHGTHTLPLLLLEMLAALLSAGLLLLAWLPAERSPARGGRWVAGLVAAVILSSLLFAALWPMLLAGTGWPSAMDLAYANKPERPGPLAQWVANTLGCVWVGGLFVAVLALDRRRRQAEAALAASLHGHAALQRQALESQLAALQARVEPQFLLDLLLDIERRYAAAEPEAPARMDSLITYLRAALPRLHEQADSGATLVGLAEEVALLQAHVALVAGLRHTAAEGGAPSPPLQMQVVLPAPLAGVQLPPMMLLPLLQWALQPRLGPGVWPQPQPDPLPAAKEAPTPAPDWVATVRLTVAQEGALLFLRLAFAPVHGVQAPPPAAAEALLQGMRPRLQLLFGAQASLTAVLAADDWCFRLQLPLPAQPGSPAR